MSRRRPSPNGFVIYCHGNIRHGPNSWCNVSQWFHKRFAWFCLVVPWSVPSFGVPMHIPSKNRAMCMALALSSRNLKGWHNNQPEVSVSSNLDVEEVAGGGWSEWGNTVPLKGWLICHGHASVAANSTTMVMVFVGWSTRRSTNHLYYSYIHQATAA